MIVLGGSQFTRCIPLSKREAIDLLTSRAFERVAPSAKRGRASERKLVPGTTTPDQKTMRTTLRKSREAKIKNQAGLFVFDKFTSQVNLGDKSGGV